MGIAEDTSSRIWSLYSWKNKPIRHQPEYEDLDELDKVLQEIESAPKIVGVEDICDLKHQLKECGEGHRMLVHLGDCAETFKDCTEPSIRNRVVLFTLCQLIMKKLLKKDITKIGRIAGQYAKPRSWPTEVVNGETISSFFGDNVNSFEANKEDRKPDPERLIKGYHWAVTTYHAIRKLTKNTVSELAKDVVEEQLREQTKLDKEAPDYEDFINIVKDCAESDSEIENLHVSHEGLLLDYESRLTKLCKDPEGDSSAYYNCSTHFLWCGERTNKYPEAHIEYFRGIKNPVGLKVGPKADPEDVVKALKLLNPENEMGKVTVILRLGAQNVSDTLPPLIEAMKKHKQNVVWVSDAVHGNTYVNDWNFKVRKVDTILEELVSVYNTLHKNDQIFGGIHLETSGDNVTECIGGITRTSDEDLFKNYATRCDPRLNFIQSLYVIYKFCKTVQKE